MSYRVIVGGGPRSGKTTFAQNAKKALSDVIVRSTDALITTHDWSATSAEVATWFDQPGPWIVEGVATIRAIRKWLASHPTGRPADAVILFWDAREPLTKGQASMAKGCQTVWREISIELRARGVAVSTQADEQLDQLVARST